MLRIFRMQKIQEQWRLGRRCVEHSLFKAWVVSWTLFGASSLATEWVDKSPHKAEFIRANGVRLHFLDWGGDGETLLFLHGMGDTAHIFDEIAPKFTNEFRVMAL